MLKVRVFDKIVASRMCSGYGGVYMLGEEDAMEIRESRSSAGFDRYEVASDCVPIDIDGGDKQIAETEEILQERGLGYSLFKSGGKGGHFYLPTDLMYHASLPYSHSQYILELGVSCDTSLYHSGHLISLEGRVHPKTKVKKHFIKEVAGKMADVKIVEKPIFTFSGGDQESTGGIAEAMMLLSNLSINEPKPGNRHTELWAISKDLIRCGLSDTTVHDLLVNIVRKWENPKTDDEIVKLISQARRQA